MSGIFGIFGGGSRKRMGKTVRERNGKEKEKDRESFGEKVGGGAKRAMSDRERRMKEELGEL